MLSQEQLREVLTRAHEIQHESGTRPSEHEVDMLVSAAGEVGLSREAVMQAMRERLNLHTPKVGDRVFAKSTDEHYYPARVLAVDGNTVRVLFLRGTEHTLRADEVKPYGLLPGQDVVVNWPWWGWWTCEVVSYDAEHDTVKVTDGWTEQVFVASEVRLNRERSKSELSMRSRIAWWVTTAAVSGGAIGTLVTWLLMR